MKVEYTCVSPSTAVEKFKLLLSSGQYPSMAHVSEGMIYPGGWDRGVADGVLIDMTESVLKYMPNYRALLEKYPDYQANCRYR